MGPRLEKPATRTGGGWRKVPFPWGASEGTQREKIENQRKEKRGKRGRDGG